MKRVTTLALLSLLVASVQAQAQTNSKGKLKPDREEHGLLGPVATLRHEWCVFASKPSKSGEYREKKHTYIETLTFDLDGNLIMKDPPDYLCGGRFIGIGNKHILKHDDQGNLVEDITFDIYGFLVRWMTQSYDSWGNVTEWAVYGRDGLIEYKGIHKYDAQGLKIESRRYRGDGYLTWKDKYVRDENGRVIEYIYYTRGGSKVSKEILDYEDDAHGNWIKKTTKELVAKYGKAYYRPSRADYRIISYY